jgi:thiol:disulfide interchange protein
MQRFDVKGLPTIVFLGLDGQELRSLRLTEFEPPDKFLARAEIAAGRAPSPVAQLP